MIDFSKYKYIRKSQPCCGIDIEPGWEHLVTALFGQIEHHIKWKRTQRATVLWAKRVYSRLTQEQKELVPSWQLHRINQPLPDRQGRVYIAQIKEKFGTLRIYIDGVEDDEIYSFIVMTETISGHVCEVCGKPGKGQSKRGWLRTLCAEHSTLLV